MFGVLVLLLLGVVAWKFVLPGERFLSDFARLLTAARVERGAFSFLSGRSSATGRFNGREVVLTIQLPRSEYGSSYLIVAMRTQGPQTLTGTAIDSRVTDDAGRKALYTLAMKDLQLTVEDGWLRALWSPRGFFVFPRGRFTEERWRPVLEALDVVASSLERRPDPS